MVPRTLAVVLVAALCAAPAGAQAPKHLAPIPSATLALMAERGTTAAAPILMRAFKREGEIEVWKRGRDGRYVLLKTFPVCRWSGQLGPKRQQGDRMVPEGFYSVAPAQMNPNSSYYLSFNIGYPNAVDRAQGATGSHIMVHGTCSSMGCFAMTDRGVAEIYALAREAFAGGQRAFQFQSYPFRLSAQNLARHRADPNLPFWRTLKEGYDRFEATGLEPNVVPAGPRYAFAPYADGAKEALVAERRRDEETRMAALIKDGLESVRTTYADGGMNPIFPKLMSRGMALGEISRPETLAFAGREVVLTPARRKVAPVVVAEAPKEPAPAPAPARAPAIAWIEAPPSVFTPQPMGAPAAPGATLAGAWGILPGGLARTAAAKGPPRTLASAAGP